MGKQLPSSVVQHPRPARLTLVVLEAADDSVGAKLGFLLVLSWLTNGNISIIERKEVYLADTGGYTCK